MSETPPASPIRVHLQRTLPRRKLLEWSINGVRFTAHEALEGGLLDVVRRPPRWTGR